MTEVVIRKRKLKGICQNKGCKNDPKGRTLCGTCRSRKYRLADPVRYAYNNHKSRAAKANIPFDLTLEEFREFCIEHIYIQSKSRAAEGYTLDRIIDDPAKGYHGYRRDNIQVLTNAENSRKYQLQKREKKLSLTFDSNGQKHWSVRDLSKVTVFDDETEDIF